MNSGINQFEGIAESVYVVNFNNLLGLDTSQAPATFQFLSDLCKPNMELEIQKRLDQLHIYGHEAVYIARIISYIRYIFNLDEEMTKAISTAIPQEVQNLAQKLKLEGREEERVEIAKNLKAEGLPIETISRVTRLSVDVINKL